MEICYSCMSKTEKGRPCYNCGYVNGSEAYPAHHLSPGSILNGKYIIGKAIGEGGFGITYIGMDLNLERKVAIKEYFPSGMVTRNLTDTVTIFTGDSEKYFYEGREKFVNEAKALAKMDKLPGIVSVIDFFMENGTSYIVMEFIEGKPFKDMLQERGRLDSEEVFHMLKSLIYSLQEIHKLGIIHRDISPDNIMITPDSQVKLIDFGAARSIVDNKSLSIQLKPGYAPEEQYRTHGEQGAWTDVYALCATMYRAITGVLPPEALERIREDRLKTPTELGISIDRNKESILMRGLALYREQRLQNMQELYDGLYNGAEFNNNKYSIRSTEHRNVNNKDMTPVLIAIIITLIVLFIVFFVLFMMIGNKQNNISSENSMDTVIATEAPTESPTEPPTEKVTAEQTSKEPVNENKNTAHNANNSTNNSNITYVVTTTMRVVNCEEWISLRASPSTSATRITKIPLGAEVGYIENASNGFYKIAYKGNVGYALARYLTSASDYYDYEPEIQLTVVNCNEWVSLRKQPSTSADKYMNVPLGARVTFISPASNGFTKVSYGGYTGYILSQYLQ